MTPVLGLPVEIHRSAGTVVTDVGVGVGDKVIPVIYTYTGTYDSRQTFVRLCKSETEVLVSMDKSLCVSIACVSIVLLVLLP